MRPFEVSHPSKTDLVFAMFENWMRRRTLLHRVLRRTCTGTYLERRRNWLMYGDFEFRSVHGHVEVFLDGAFQFSADTREEAVREIREEGDEPCTKVS